MITNPHTLRNITSFRSGDTEYLPGNVFALVSFYNSGPITLRDCEGRYLDVKPSAFGNFAPLDETTSVITASPDLLDPFDALTDELWFWGFALFCALVGGGLVGIIAAVIWWSATT